MDQTVYPPPPPPPPPPVPPAFAAAPPPEPPIPWETPGRPAGEALIETVKLFATDMGQAFRRMPAAGDLAKPLLYAVIVGSIGPIVAQLTSIFLPNPFFQMLQERLGGGAGSELFARSAAAGVFGIFFVPVAVVVGLFIGAGIVHLCLMLVGGANSGFLATVRVMCYSSTGQLAQAVPLIGGLVAFVLVLILEVKGLETAHRTTTGKAIAAVLIPVAFCCVCVVLFVVTLGAALIGMLKG
jgi:hypothetical protein